MPTRAAYPCPNCRHLSWRRDRNGHAKCHVCGHAQQGHDSSADARGYDATWRATVRAVLARDGRTCQIRMPGCTGTATTGDHIVPKARGGTDDPDNVQAACHHCNSSKQARLF